MIDSKGEFRLNDVFGYFFSVLFCLVMVILFNFTVCNDLYHCWAHKFTQKIIFTVIIPFCPAGNAFEPFCVLAVT